MHTEYRPFRNRLRQLNVWRTLEAIHAYSRHLSVNDPLPVHLMPNLPVWDRRQVGTFIYQWELEQLAREIILNGERYLGRKIDWNEIARIIPSMRTLNDLAYGMLGSDVTILHELHRTAHRQFPFQRGPSVDDFVRYYKIYNHPTVAPLMSDQFGMSPIEFYQVAMALVGHYLQDAYLRLPVHNELNTVPDAHIHRLVETISRSLSDLAARVRDLATYDANWTYYFDPLRLYPLIMSNDRARLMCPIPSLLSWRLTDGIFFDLVARSDFAEGLGRAFEDYIEQVLDRGNHGQRYEVLPEQEYGTRRRRRDSVDFMVVGDDATLFLECKTRRQSLDARIDLTDLASFRASAETMASYVVQLYSTLSDALLGEYPHWQYHNEPIYPVIVTLSDWFVQGEFSQEIDNMVRQQMNAADLDLGLLTAYPYTICSSAEFELLIQIMAHRGFHDLMATKTNDAHRLWMVHPFLANYYNEAHRIYGRQLFPEVMDELGRRHR